MERASESVRTGLAGHKNEERKLTGFKKDGVIVLKPKIWVHDVKVISSERNDQKHNKASPPK